MVLSVKKVEFSYGSVPVLRDVNFEVKEGILFQYWELMDLVNPL
jgi:ABC-type cobalamin/Fe3+-siderophores transport systems, ATPase components